MRRVLGGTVLALGFLTSGGLARAQFLHPPAPSPVPVVIQGPVFLLPPAPYRPSAYEHWRYRDVTTQGLFRPVVIYSSTYGAYYLSDGAPFPTAPLRTPVEFKPVAPE